MKINFNYQPLQLTAEEKEKLQLQELSPDPAERLFTHYYEKTHQLIFDDYYQRGKQKEDLDAAMEDLLAYEQARNKLIDEELNDWKLFKEMQRIMRGSFSVKKLRLRFEA